MLYQCDRDSDCSEKCLNFFLNLVIFQKKCREGKESRCVFGERSSGTSGGRKIDQRKGRRFLYFISCQGESAKGGLPYVISVLKKEKKKASIDLTLKFKFFPLFILIEKFRLFFLRQSLAI